MLTLYKIPLKSVPLVYLRDRLKSIDTYKTVVIVPTNRNLRKLAGLFNWQLDIQTVPVFTRRANLYNSVLLPPQLRGYYLYKAVKKLSETDRQMLLRAQQSAEVSGYMNFLLKSSALLPFFRELCVERIDTTILTAASQYHDYSEQVDVLTGLWQIYCDVVSEAGFADEWQCYANPMLDNKYLERYDTYIFLIGGYLNNYEMFQLRTIAEKHNTELFFNFTGAMHHQSEKFADEFDAQIQTAENDDDLAWYMEDEVAAASAKTGEHPIFVAHTYAEDKNGRLPSADSGTYTEIAPCEGGMAQYELITRRILREHLENGIALESMAVILPSPDFTSWFLDSDIYGLYNVSAGRPVRSFSFFQALTSIHELIRESDETGINMTNLEQLAANKWLFKDNFSDIFNTMRKNGKLYISLSELAEARDLYAVCSILKPFFKPVCTYTDLIKDVTALLKAMKKHCEKEERAALDKTVDELDKMGVIYKNIDEEMPTDAVLNSLLGELSSVSGATSARGVPVIGLLESRNMQYDTLFIPDMNIGVFPPAQGKDLFLNSEIRRTLGLPTFADRQELQKNYYLQLIARSKKALITYALSDEREASPFINEILTQSKARLTDIPKYSPRYRITVPETGFYKAVKAGQVEKGEEMRELLAAKTYSATSLECYRKCRLQFFYKYVKYLFPMEEGIDEIDMRVLGNVLDSTVHKLFLKGVTALDDAYLPLMKKIYSEEIKKYDYFTKDAVGIFHADALKDRFPPLVQKDREYLQQSELIKQHFKEKIHCVLHNVKFTAELDRWDETKSGYFIIDYKYKNLGRQKTARHMEDFDDKGADLQMPLYATMMQQKCGKLPAGIFWFDLKGDGGLVKAFDMELFDTFRTYLGRLMESILTDKIFEGSNDEAVCELCLYKGFCPESLV